MACKGGLVSSGDDRTGGNSVSGDDEEIVVDFSKLPEYVAKVEVYVTIHDAVAKNHNFGLLKDAYAKIYNNQTGEELYLIDLDEEAGGKTAVHVASLVKQANGHWTIVKSGTPSNDDLGSIFAKHKIPTE